MLPHFLKHCSNLVLSRTCVSPLPVTSTFVQMDTGFHFLNQSTLHNCLIVDLSVFLTWDTDPFCIRISYFSNSFLMIPLNLFLFQFFGSLQDFSYVCVDFPLSDFCICHFPFFGHLSLSHPLNPMPCFQRLLCCVLFATFISMMLLFLWCFYFLFWNLTGHISSPQ